MARTNTDLSIYQWGKETVKGTAVAATSRMAVPRVVFNEVGEVYRPQLAKGLVIRNKGDEQVSFRHTEWSIPSFPISLQTLPNLLSMAVRSGITPTGTPPDYLWTFTRDITTKILPDTWTLERRISDGTNFIDAEWPYAFITSLGLSIAPKAVLMAEVAGAARRIQPSTFTPALAMPISTYLPFSDVEVWIDSTWATLGTTKISGALIGCDLSFNTGFFPLYTADGRTDLDFSAEEVSSDETQLEASIQLYAEAGAGSAYVTEKAAAAAQTLRAVRIKATISATAYLQIDFLAKYSSPDIETFEDENGLEKVTLELEETTDNTNFLSIKVANAIATLV